MLSIFPIPSEAKQYVYGDLTSFEDMKKHSSKRFKEITKRLREESKKTERKKRTKEKTGSFVKS